MENPSHVSTHSEWENEREGERERGTEEGGRGAKDRGRGWEHKFILSAFQ